MDKKKIALIVVVLFLLIGLGSFVFANPDQDNSLEGPGVSEDGGSGDGEAIDGTTPTATPTEEGNGQTTLGTNPVTTIGNGGTGTGTNGSDSTEVTGGIGNTEMSAYEDAAKIVAELENKVASMTNRDESNAAIDYRTNTDIMNIVNGLPDGEEKDQLLDRLATINKVLDDKKPPVISGINNEDVTKENVTINVTDDNDVVITATLDGEAIDFTTPLTEEGKYVVIVTDKNFNSSTVEFTIDKHAPTRQVLRLTNISQKDANENYLQIAKAGDTVRVIVQFDEELATLPTLKINGVEVGQMKYDSNMSSYTFDYHVTEDDVNGIMQIEISNYADAAGNVGGILTNAEINHDTQNQMIIDTVLPVLEGLTDGMFTNKTISLKISDTNWDYIHVNQVGVREFDETRQWTGLLDDGVYELQAFDKAGNTSAVITVTKDSVAPVISKVPDGQIVNWSVSPEVADDNLATVTLTKDDVTVEGYQDNMYELSHDGVYVITAIDKAGNKTEMTFTIDKTAPVKTNLLFHSSNANNNQLAKPGDYFGVYLTVNEELKENPKFIVNGVEYTANQFYQAEGVYQYSAVYAIPANTPAQEMTFTISNIVDKAGNTLADLTNADANDGVNTIVYDNVSPGPKVLGITGFFDEAENADPHYIKYGEKVRILAYFDEKLSVAPTVKIGNKEFQSYYAVDSSNENNSSYAYYTDIEITSDLGLNDGEIQFKLYGYKDLAGNQGREYTNADITYGDSNLDELCYDKVILDNVAPKFNVTSGTHSEKTMDIEITDENFAYAVVVNQDTGEKNTVYETNITLDQEATYHVYAYDKAENVADLWVAIDNEKPNVAISGTGLDGYYNSDVNVIVTDKFLTSVKVNDVAYDRSDFISDSRGENFEFTTKLDQEGTYKVTAADKYGHINEKTFVIDKTVPTITGVQNNGIYNNPVTLTIVEENLNNANYQKDGGEWVPFASGTVFDKDGSYVVKVSDKAGNVSKDLAFTIDQTAPVVKAANILVDGDANEQTEFYATTGDTIYSYVRFSEELKQNPKFYLVNNGTEYEVSDVTVTGPNDNGEYTYSIRYTITENNTMADGQIEMKVTGISDKAGNTIADITKPTNRHIVYLDRIAPVTTAFRMVGGNRETSTSTYMYATNGAKIYIYAEFADKLAVSPKALINNSIEVSFNDGTLRGDRYIYTAIYTLTENDGINDGEFQVKVYGYADEAGNVGKDLTNADITLESQKHIIVDKTAPVLNISPLTDEGYSNGKSLGVSGTDANKLGVVITNAEGTVVRADSSSQGSDGTYWTAYDIENQVNVDGQYTAVASDIAGNKTEVKFTVDREAPVFDLSAIPTTFTIGEDIYKYPQPGKVTDNIDGTISFSKVHMNWYHKNADDTKGEATKCFGGNNWNTSLTSCEPGDYIITYRVSDKTGNVAYEEQTITLVQKKENERPVVTGIESNQTYNNSVEMKVYDDSDSITIYTYNDLDTDIYHILDVNTIITKGKKLIKDFHATKDHPYSITFSHEKNLNILVIDSDNAATWIKNVTIDKA